MQTRTRTHILFEYPLKPSEAKLQNLTNKSQKSRASYVYLRYEHLRSITATHTVGAAHQPIIHHAIGFSIDSD